VRNALALGRGPLVRYVSFEAISPANHILTAGGYADALFDIGGCRGCGNISMDKFYLQQACEFLFHDEDNFYGHMKGR
jgi:hypothetical protein